MGDIVEFDLKSAIGFFAPGTMKVRGKVGNKDVMVLIDCGTAHNFISHRLVDEWELPKTETTNYDTVTGTTLL